MQSDHQWFCRFLSCSLPSLIALLAAAISTSPCASDETEITSPASRIERNLSVLQDSERPLTDDLAFINNGFRMMPTTPAPAITGLQHDLYLHNQRQLTRIYGSAQQILTLTGAQLLEELRQRDLDYSILRRQYLYYATSSFPLGHYAVVAALVYGTFNAITLHPLSSLVSFVSAAAFYQISGTLHNQHKTYLQTRMHNLNQVMEELNTRGQQYHGKLMQLGNILQHGRWLALQNLIISQGVPLLDPDQVPPAVSRRYQQCLNLASLNEANCPLTGINLQLPLFLEALNEYDIFVISFAKNNQTSDQKNSYRLVRHQQVYYLGLPATDAQGVQNVSFAAFTETEPLTTFLTHAARLSDAERFGYMSFHPGMMD